MAPRCDAKCIFKSKCTKYLRRGAIVEVLIRKNCTLMWREAHLQVKMHKTHIRGAILEVLIRKNGNWSFSHLVKSVD